jgi:acetamidase/formamidase
MYQVQRRAAATSTPNQSLLVAREHSLDPLRAYMLRSAAVNLRISEIVDFPN